MKHQFSLDPFRAELDNLVERERELAGIADLADLCSSGPSSGMIALVYGEAGIGKTSLINRFIRQIEDNRTILLGRCDPMVAGRPFGPLYDMSDRLRSTLDSDQRDGRSRTDIFSALAAELVAIDQNTVLIFEDTHWIDPSTADFLNYLGRRITNHGFLIVISYRADEIATGHPLRAVLGALPHQRTVRFPLSPLSPDAVTGLLGCEREDAEAIHRVSGGNPFFVSELLASGGELPLSVQDLITARLGRQSPQVRSVVELISVSPDPVSAHLLTELAGEDAIDAALQAVEEGLLRQGDGGRFSLSHELARLAIYDSLPRARRRQLHRQFRAVLAHSNNSASLAVQLYHADAAQDGVAVLEVALLAARAAARLGAHQEAFEQTSIALKYLADADDRTAAEIHEQWAGSACVSTCMDDRVIAARATAARLWLDLDEKLQAADNLRWLSRLHWYRCEPAEARTHGNRAIELLRETGDARAAALAQALEAQLLFLDLEMDEAVKAAQSAVAMARASNSVEAEVHALNTLGAARSFMNAPDGASQIGQSIELAERASYAHYANRDADIARGFLNLADHATDFRKFEMAEDIITRGCRLCSDIDLESWVMQFTGRRAEIFLEQGRIAEAMDLAREVLSYDAMTPQASQRIKLSLAKAASRIGDTASKDSLEECLQMAGRSEDPGLEISARLAIVEWGFLNQDTHRANLELDRLASIPVSRFHIWNAASRRAWHNHFRGHVELPEVEGAPRGFQLESDGEHGEAFRWFVDAGLPLEALLHALRNLRDLSEDEIREANSLAVSVGADALNARFARLPNVQHRRRKRGPYKSARSHPLGLTSKEIEVLTSVNRGATNREIADKMSRSVRTVDRHVSALIRKLGVSSRVEIIVRLGNEPWIIAPPSERASKISKDR